MYFVEFEPLDKVFVYFQMLIFHVTCFHNLTHYHTIPYFDTLTRYSFGKHCEKRRNCLEQAISPFLAMFSTLNGTYFLSSLKNVVCNLVQFGPV